MTRIKLLIVCESADGAKALPVARVEDRSVLVSAAEAVIRSKQAEASALAALDENLGTVAQEEATRIERTLMGLIPELRLHSRCCPALAM